MPRIAGGFPPGRPLARRIARAISMGHYQRDLVLRLATDPLDLRPSRPPAGTGFGAPIQSRGAGAAG